MESCIFCSGNNVGQAPCEKTGAVCEQCDSGVCRNGLCADAGKYLVGDSFFSSM